MLLGVLIVIYPILSYQHLVLLYAAFFNGLVALLVFTRNHLIGTLLYGVGGIILIFVKSKMKMKDVEGV